MKKIAFLAALVATWAQPLFASGDGENNPRAFKQEILNSQFVFIGALSVTNFVFSDDKGRVVPDPDSKIAKAFAANRYVFENAIADPESLLLLPNEELEKAFEIEGGGDGMLEPSGQPWSEDEAELEVRYPRLWKRFGHQPLV